MHDDLVLLFHVIDAGGFSAASVQMGMPVSTLSRRIEEMERRLHVQLVDRTTRSFRPTPLGQALAQEGERIRQRGEIARSIVEESLAKPSGILRIASPAVLTERLIADFCISFAARNPQVFVTLDMTDGNRPPQMDAYDIVLVASIQQLPDSDMIARHLLNSSYLLVASPAWIARHGAVSEPADLQDRPAIGWLDEDHSSQWSLVSDNGEVAKVRIKARMNTNNLTISRKAALQGLGMARLPVSLCSEDVVSGALVPLLPQWRPPTMQIHALYRTRRSLQLAGKLFLSELFQLLQAQQTTFDDGFLQ